MSKTNVSDIFLLAFISGVVAVLTSMLGISGTIIGAVVTSLIAETLKTYFKEPLKQKVSERVKNTYNSGYDDVYATPKDSYEVKSPIQEKFHRESTYQNQHYTYYRKDDSFLTARILYIFPLVVILLIELVHFLGAINVIPYDIFYSLESITNWRLLTTIGYALIIMGVYPFFSNKLDNKIGIVLIVVGIVELLFGYADSIPQFYVIVSYLSSLREYLNIAIILAILYTILTIPEKEEDDGAYYY